MVFDQEAFTYLNSLLINKYVFSESFQYIENNSILIFFDPLMESKMSFLKHSI